MGLRVIGAGWGRTGTASLKLALERLGFGPCHHMSEVLPDPERVALWSRIGAGEDLLDAALEGYRSTVDWPVCNHWRALMERRPEAKVVLTVRDPDSWFESVNATILNPRAAETLAPTPMGEMLHRNVWRLFEGRLDDRAFMRDCFERHTEEVAGSVPADRLLVFRAKDGWGPLCRFLGVAEPETPYPHVNTKEETAKMMEILAAQLGGGDLREAAGRMFAG